MPNFLYLPKLGVDMVEAKIVKWIVKEGDVVKEGDTLVEVETDKAVQEIHATTSGIIKELLIEEGETVLCQQPIISFVEPGENIDKEVL